MFGQMDEWDRAAERWLTDRHRSDWYIGDATDDEWREAYAATRRLDED